MDNNKALELLDAFEDAAARASRAAVWAQAYLITGGESTWDAVKHVSDLALDLNDLATQVGSLRDQFDEITPF